LNISGTGAERGQVTIDLSGGETVNLSGRFEQHWPDHDVAAAGVVDLSGTLTGDR